jgi:hypothetical protein
MDQGGRQILHDLRIHPRRRLQRLRYPRALIGIQTNPTAASAHPATRIASRRPIDRTHRQRDTRRR